MIIFSSLEFIFRFLPVFLICYYITPARYRNVTLFLGSVFLYATGEPYFIVLLLVSIIVNYLLGVLIFRARQNRVGAVLKAGLTGAVLYNIAILILCKYLALTRDASLLPIGLSFYLFKMISFQADMYRGTIRQEPDFIKAAAYFSMFPQITQGPIMRYSNGLFDRTIERKCTPAGFENGLVYFVIGLSFKVLLADRLGILWNEISKIGYESISVPLAWMGAFGYSFQLYFDFWGYSLMAGGLGRMLGFPFVTNFMHPYAADGIADFYRRWHITLGEWFKDYVYFPLGGSRKGSFRTILNLLVVWALTGLWHGGTVNFLIWGFVLGALIIWEKFVLKDLMKRFPVIGHLHVWILIPLTWVIFAVSDLKQLGIYFTRLFPIFGSGVAVDPADFLKYGRLYWPYFLAAVLFSLTGIYKILIRRRKNILVLLFLNLLFWTSMFYLVTTSGNAFLYFTF